MPIFDRYWEKAPHGVPAMGEKQYRYQIASYIVIKLITGPHSVTAGPTVTDYLLVIKL